MIDEVIRLSTSDQVVEGQAAGGGQRVRDTPALTAQIRSEPDLWFRAGSVYLDSRTLQVLLVKFEMTSWRISFRYLSTCGDSTLIQLRTHLEQQNPTEPYQGLV